MHSGSLSSWFVVPALLIGLLATPEPSGAVESNGASKLKTPNIVIILGDDVGYGDLGCYGARAVQTPNVDRLARKGLRFTSAYATSATCTPSRFSLMTGKYAFREKDALVLPGDAPLLIQPGSATLPAILQRAGYTTGAVGKWHLGLGEKGRPADWNGEVKPGPLETGFDYAFIMAATGDRVPCVFLENHRVVGLDPADPIQVSYQKPFPGEPVGTTNRHLLKMDWSHDHNNAVINGIGRIGFMKGGKSALWKDDEMAGTFARKAGEFIDTNHSRPFFLYFATHDIHVPRVPNRQFVGKTTMGPRGDAILEFDWCVGQILQALERHQLLENTLIILSSDNGPVLDDGYKDGAVEKVGRHTPAGPLRAGKGSTFEGGTRIPFIVHWPGRVRPGVSDALISQVDLLASLAAFTGQSMDRTQSPDSQNMLPALLGDSRQGRTNLVEYAGHKGGTSLGLRQGDWLYISPGATLEKLGPYKRLEIPAPGLLFNLAADPGQTNDLAVKFPEKVKELGGNLTAVVNGTGPTQ